MFYKNPFYKIVEQQTQLETMSIMKIQGGRRVWRNPAGELHREEGPAVEFVNGSTAWYFHGKQHRTDGPAVEFGNYKVWYFHGQYHRTDGPAILHQNGDKEWLQFGEKHRTDGPADERANGNKEWWWRGLRHRADGPAFEGADGSRLEWWRHGRLHRIDGPATKWYDGERNWYIHDQKVSKPEVVNQVSQLQLKVLMLTRTVNPFCEINVAKHVL